MGGGEGGVARGQRKVGLVEPETHFNGITYGDEVVSHLPENKSGEILAPKSVACVWVIFQVVIVVALSAVVGVPSLPLMSRPYTGWPCAQARIRLPTPPVRQQGLFPLGV